MTDRLALERWIRERDANAFHEIVNRYADMVYATCRRVLHNPTEAEDASQECFEALSQASAPPGEYLGQWLHRVATNLAAKRVRSEVRRARREGVFAQGSPASAEVEWDDLYGEVDEAIEALPEELRAPLVAHFLERSSHAEVAQALGLPRQTVTNRIHRGVEEVRRELRKKGIVLGAAALLLFLEGGTAEAAPRQLVAALGRRAIAGVTGAKGSGAAVAGAGSMAIPAKWIAAATTLALATAALVAVSLAVWSNRESDADPAQPPAAVVQAPAATPEASGAPGRMQAGGTSAPPREGTVARPQTRDLPPDQLPEEVVGVHIQTSR